MAERLELVARSHLAGFDMPAAEGAALREVSGRAMLSVACHAANASRVARAFKAATGVALPKVGRVVENQGMVVIWSGLNQWLVLVDEASVGAVHEKLNAALKGRAAITDQCDAFVVLELAGPRARDVLALLCPIDLDRSVFGPGDTARTLAGHLSVQLSQVGGSEDEPVFQLLAARSSARDLVHDLAVAIAGVGAK